MTKTENTFHGMDELKVSGAKPASMKDICYDSRKVTRNCVFVAIKGANVDGHDFIPDAIRRGATTIVAAEKPKKPLPSRVTLLLTSNPRAALAKMSDYFYDSPSEKLHVMGVTGTNGKTTVTYLIESIMSVEGKRCGRIGTIGYNLLEEELPAPNTTPESLDLQRMMVALLDRGASHLALEVSSHALLQSRVDNIRFREAIFTNLTKEHLDYHGNMDEYFAAKRKLFIDLEPETAVLNVDDPYGQRLAAETKAKKFTYGLETSADYKAEDITLGDKSISFTIKTPTGSARVRSNLSGRYNVYNILAATATAVNEGVSLESIVEGVEALKIIPGRMERVDLGQPFVALVDYAHTADALANVIQSARQLTKGKVITVFGCGGDRDKTKRPDMGEMAWTLSDKVVVTTDNPRTEAPEKIIDDILGGIHEKDNPRGEMKVVIDRREALNTAVMLVEHGDLVLVAGKGHEDYQIIGKEKLHFDDREELGKAIEKRYGKV